MRVPILSYSCVFQREHVRGFDASGLPVFGEDGVPLGAGPPLPFVNVNGNFVLSDDWWMTQVWSVHSF